MLRHKMPVVGRELVSQHPAGIPLPSLGEDLLDGIVVLRFVEPGRPGVASVHGVIIPIRFVRTFWSSQLGIFSELNSPEKSPDTLSSPGVRSDGISAFELAALSVLAFLVVLREVVHVNVWCRPCVLSRGWDE